VGRALGATLSEEDDESILAELAEIEAEQALGAGAGVGVGSGAAAATVPAARPEEAHFSGVVFPEAPTTSVTAAPAPAVPAGGERVAVPA
jgi:hypothetical protein